MVDGFISVVGGGLFGWFVGAFFLSGLCEARLVALGYGGNLFISLQNIPLRFLLIPFAERSNWKGRRNPASRFQRRIHHIYDCHVISPHHFSDRAKLCHRCCSLFHFLESQTERRNEAFEEKHLLCVNCTEIAVAVEASH